MGFGKTNADSNVNAFCEEKFRSLSESELRALAEVCEESLAQIQGVRCSIAVGETIALGGSGCKYQPGKGRIFLSSTPLNVLRSSSCDVLVSIVISEESPSKRTSEVASNVIEQAGVSRGICPSEKKEKRVAEERVVTGQLQLLAGLLKSGFRKWLQWLVKEHLLDLLVHLRSVMLLWELSYLQEKSW